MTSGERAGLLFAALCALNGAFVPAVARLTSTRAAPLVVATATSLFAGMAALVVLAARRELRVLIGRRSGPRLVALGALGTSAALLCFYEGSRRTSAIVTALCMQIEPLYALVGAWIVLGHRPTPRRALAIVVLLAGIALALTTDGAFSAAGVAFLLVTPLCWQLSHLLVLRGLPGVSPPALTGARYAYGGVLLTLACVLREPVSPASAGALVPLLPLLAVQGVVLSYLGTVVWYAAIARLDLTRTTAIVVPSIPLLSLGASFALVGEMPTARQCIGLVLAAAGVLTFVTVPHATSPDESVPHPAAALASLRAPADSGAGREEGAPRCGPPRR